MAPVDNTSLISSAWKRTKSSWKNYLIVTIFYITLPFVIAFLISIGALVGFPFIAAIFGKSSQGLTINVITAVFSILLPAAACITAFYLSFLGSIAIVKSIIDPAKDRKAIFSESRALLTPYIYYITASWFLNAGFFIYMPLTLFTLSIFMNIWNQFAMFSFVEDSQKGVFNIWKGVKTYKNNFWEVTGQAIVLLLFGTLISNIGNTIMYTSWRNRSHDTVQNVIIGHLLAAALSVLFQIFSIAYLYELYARIKKPAVVKVPTLWLFFSIFGWVLTVVSIVVIGNFLIHNPQIILKAIHPKS